MALMVFLWLAMPRKRQSSPAIQSGLRRSGSLLLLEQEVLPHRINTIVVIPASADNYIASEQPNENFGNDALFLGYNLAGANNFGAERRLLQFDIASTIPDGAIINSAVLNLYLSFSSPASAAPMGTVLRRLASPWNEYSVTRTVLDAD
jgi:hypothetical protein